MAKETLYEGVDLPSDPNLPVWLLTPKEEKLIFQRWRKKAFVKCDEYIKRYIACLNSYENALEAMVKCKGVSDEQLKCVAEYQKVKYLDDERDILIKEKLQKKNSANNNAPTS